MRKNKKLLKNIIILLIFTIIFTTPTSVYADTKNKDKDKNKNKYEKYENEKIQKIKIKTKIKTNMKNTRMKKSILLTMNRIKFG